MLQSKAPVTEKPPLLSSDAARASSAHPTASFKCSTVKGELLAIAGDCAVARGAPGGTR